MIILSTAGAHAAPLNPGSFLSLGTMNVTSGSITINTDTLAITGAATFNGGTVSQGAGNPEVAVFTFSNFNIGAGVPIAVIGSRPLALLSQGSMSISSAISLNGGNASGAAAGAAGPAGGYVGGTGNPGTPGGGPGGGTVSGLLYGGGGGGYGGAGGAGATGAGSSTGGAAYGDLTTLLQGGSGGSGAGGNGGGGGGGGGAIELGALGTLTLTAALTSNGGQPGSIADEGGGGAGGGILLHAPAYSLTSLSALGGLGAINGASTGGGGGGGRIALSGGQLSVPQISSLSTSVHGGDAQSILGASAGKAGVLTFKPDMLTVQSGQTANIGITPGQTGRTDARIELLPTSFTVQNGGTATIVSGPNYVQPTGGSINIAGGQLNVNTNLQIPTGATLRYTNGTLNVGAGTTLIFNGGVGSFSQPWEVSNLGGLQVTSGGDLVSTSSVNAASINTSGNIFVSGPGSTINAVSGIWGLSSGSTSEVTFSSSGVGTFNTVLMAAQGATTTLTLSSNGQLATSTQFRVGPAIGTSPSIVNIGGGTLNSQGTTEFRGGTLVNLTSGGMILAGGGTFSGGSTLNWSGGTINLGAGRTLAFDGSVGTTSVANYTLPSSATLRITNGGQFAFPDVLQLANAAGAAGTVVVDGVNSRLTTGTSSLQNWASNAGNFATVTFSNQAAGTLGIIQLAANGGQAILNVSGGASLRTTGFFAGGAAAGSAVTINLAGTLNVGSIQLLGSSILNFNSGSFNSIGLLGISQPAQMQLSTGRDKVVNVGSLAFSGTGKLNLSDNSLILNYSGASPFATIRNQIITGRNGGNWLGNQLTSSAAAASLNTGLGIAEASALGSPATFLGQPIDATSILVRHTLLGDADLSGGVNLDDFTRLAAGFGSGTVWTQGDFNYDGVVNLDDFTNLAANFGLSLPAGAARAAVPEPAGAALLGIIRMMARRSRRRRPSSEGVGVLSSAGRVSQGTR